MEQINKLRQDLYLWGLVTPERKWDRHARPTCAMIIPICVKKLLVRS